MSPRRPVPDLYKLTIANVGDIFASFLRKHRKSCSQFHLRSCQKLQRIRRYVLSELAIDICHDILMYIRKKKWMDVRVKSLALQLFVTENYNNFEILQVREFTTISDLGIHKYLKKIDDNRLFCVPPLFATDALDESLDLAENLRILKLDCFSITNGIIAKIGQKCKFVQQLSIKISFPTVITTGIQKFIYKDYPENKILNDICTNLKCLSIATVCSRMLVRSFVTNVDFYVDAVDVSIKRNCEVRHNGHSLGSLDENTVDYFKYDAVTYLTICDLVENLSSLKEFIYVRAGRVIVQLVSEGRSYPKELEYIHDSLSTVQTIEVLSNACPLLENLWIEFTNSCAFLANLQCFPKLTILKIDGDSSVEDFEAFLVNCGATITQLTIGNIVGTIDIHLMSSKCPELTQLVITATGYKYGGRKTFEKLEKFALGSDWFNPASFSRLIYDMPCVKSLEFSPGHSFTDEVIANLISTCPMASLERLIIEEGYNIHLASFKNLISHCPSLVTLGITNYIRSTTQELAEFKSKLRNENVQVALIQDAAYVDTPLANHHASDSSCDEEDSFG